jgi:hypothetical protein
MIMLGKAIVFTLHLKKMIQLRRLSSGCGKVGGCFLSTFPQPEIDLLRSVTDFRWEPEHFYRKILAQSFSYNPIKNIDSIRMMHKYINSYRICM